MKYLSIESEDVWSSCKLGTVRLWVKTVKWWKKKRFGFFSFTLDQKKKSKLIHTFTFNSVFFPPHTHAHPHTPHTHIYTHSERWKACVPLQLASGAVSHFTLPDAAVMHSLKLNWFSHNCLSFSLQRNMASAFTPFIISLSIYQPSPENWKHK